MLSLIRAHQERLHAQQRMVDLYRKKNDEVITEAKRAAGLAGLYDFNAAYAVKAYVQKAVEDDATSGELPGTSTMIGWLDVDEGYADYNVSIGYPARNPKIKMGMRRSGYRQTIGYEKTNDAWRIYPAEDLEWTEMVNLETKEGWLDHLRDNKNPPPGYPQLGFRGFVWMCLLVNGVQPTWSNPARVVWRNGQHNSVAIFI